jgi:hypothetical protein
LEIQLIYSFIEKQSKEKEQAEAAPQPQEKNMFEAYRAQTEGMQESPSEFGL